MPKCPEGCTCGKHKRQEPDEDVRPSLSGPDDLSRDAEPEGFTTPEEDTAAGINKLTYHDRGHRYYLNGKRAKGVSTISKIAADDYQIRLWHERMVALGVTIDSNLRENVAMHAENKDALKDLCEDAKKVAKAHIAADRGSQKHRVLELVLTGQEDKLITPQQRFDAVVLKRTMDRYRLTPRTELAEQFVIYPDNTICGRFDAVLAFETADGRTVLVDLKSGENAVKYPHSTSAQLAMYARAPHISVGEHRGDKITVETWGTMPENIDLDTAYVLLVTNEDQVGTLHQFNIEHGWQAAELAMSLIKWRQAFKYGDDLVGEVEDRFAEAVRSATTDSELRAIWKEAGNNFALTEYLKGKIMHRLEEVRATA